VLDSPIGAKIMEEEIPEDANVILLQGAVTRPAPCSRIIFLYLFLNNFILPVYLKVGMYMLTLLPKEKRETAREYAIRVLRHNIIYFNLKPGQFVSEKEIAEVLGVSRTPVREAFIELARSSLVEIYPQKGTCISPIDIDMVEESRFMRCTLEKAIAQMCCDYVTPTDIINLEENLKMQRLHAEKKDYIRLLSLDYVFHEQLFKICRKENTYKIIKSAMAQFDRVRILNFAEMDMKITVDEHTQILEAIKKKDKKLAGKLMEKHLTRVIFDMSYLKEKHPEFFKRGSIENYPRQTNTIL